MGQTNMIFLMTVSFIMQYNLLRHVQQPTNDGPLPAGYERSFLRSLNRILLNVDSIRIRFPTFFPELTLRGMFSFYRCFQRFPFTARIYNRNRIEIQHSGENRETNRDLNNLHNSDLFTYAMLFGTAVI